mmetsp:Transcript_14881/g.26197  ORF Transcript_14881/g.26197 Transcript_14881/m.26197 type:complete len:222 (-) Transcript_14881:166-831(-)
MQQPRQMKKIINSNAGSDCSTTRAKSVKTSLYLPNLKTRKTRVSLRILRTTRKPPLPPSPWITSSQKGKIASKSIRFSGEVCFLSVLINLPSSLSGGAPGLSLPEVEPCFNCARARSPTRTASKKNSSSNWNRTLWTVNKRMRYSRVKVITETASMTLKTTKGSGAHSPISKSSAHSALTSCILGKVDIIQVTMDRKIMPIRKKEHILESTDEDSPTSTVR